MTRTGTSSPGRAGPRPSVVVAPTPAAATGPSIRDTVHQD